MELKKLPIPYGYGILLGIGLGILWGLKSYLLYLYWGELKHFSWWKHGYVHVVNYGFWAVLLPLVYYFFNKYKLHNSASTSEKAMAVLTSFFLAFLHEALSNLIFLYPLQWLGILEVNHEQWMRVLKSFPAAFTNRLIEYWILFAILTALDFQKKYRNKQIELAQLEQQLSNAQLKAIKGQLEPHFLFNTLNTISSLMEINVKDAQKVVSQLGALLRTVLEKNKRKLIPFEEELEFIKNYLNIEQVRFQDRLKITYNIASRTNDFPIPSLILQPLVENAIKHGFARTTGEGLIEVAATLEDEQIQISITDNGQGTELSQEAMLQKGQGLQIVEDRLKLLYKDQYTFSFNTAPNGGFKVQLILPRLNDKVD
jgi:signal transduction histidine kinase